MYALRAPEEVYKILKTYQTDYIILEDSICLMPSKPNYCSLKEILDISNNHVSFLTSPYADHSTTSSL